MRVICKSHVILKTLSSSVISDNHLTAVALLQPDEGSCEHQIAYNKCYQLPTHLNTYNSNLPNYLDYGWTTNGKKKKTVICSLIICRELFVILFLFFILKSRDDMNVKLEKCPRALK